MQNHKHIGVNKMENVYWKEQQDIEKINKLRL